MHCHKCGTELPDYAEFCYACGTKVGVDKEINNELQRKSRINTPRKVLYALVLLWGIYLIVSCYAPRLKKAEVIPTENTVILRGELVVGEDLEPGTYDIRGANDTHYIFMLIKTGSSEDRLNTYDAVHNYRLKEGYIIESEYEAAFTKLD